MEKELETGLPLSTHKRVFSNAKALRQIQRPQ